MSEIKIWSLVIQTIYKFLSTLRNLEMTNDTNDPTARRRRIVERGSDRLALITGARVTNQPSSSSSETAHHSYNASCPPSVTRLPDQPDENKAETAVCKVKPVLHKSGSTKVGSSRESSTKSREIQSSTNQSTHQTTSKQKIYLYKTVSPSQLRPAILASQETRRKCSFFAGVVALLSHIGFPILGSYVIRSIILSRPLLLLLLINVIIIFGPLLLDAMKVIQQEANNGSPTSEADIPDNLGSPFEWGMLFKTGLSAFFMDSCIYSVVVICGMSILQKFGL